MKSFYREIKNYNELHNEYINYKDESKNIKISLLLYNIQEFKHYSSLYNMNVYIVAKTNKKDVKYKIFAFRKKAFY